MGIEEVMILVCRKGLDDDLRKQGVGIGLVEEKAMAIACMCVLRGIVLVIMSSSFF